MPDWAKQHFIRWSLAAVLGLAALPAGASWMATSLRSSSGNDQEGAKLPLSLAVSPDTQSHVVQAQFSAINPRVRGNARATKRLRLPAVTDSGTLKRLPPVEVPRMAQRLPPVEISSVMQRLPLGTSLPRDLPETTREEKSEQEKESERAAAPDLVPLDTVAHPEPPQLVETVLDRVTGESPPADGAQESVREQLTRETQPNDAAIDEAVREPAHHISSLANQQRTVHESSQPDAAADKSLVMPTERRPTKVLEPNDPLLKIPGEMRHNWNDPAGGLAVAGRQAEQLVRNASMLASRGATYSARRDLEAALVVLSQALDAHYETTAFTQCLRSGLLALEEAGDFAPSHARGQLNLDVALIVSRHRSGSLSAEASASCTPVEATRKYYTFAQDHVAAACGGSSMAAHALFGMGKLDASMAKTDTAAERRLGQRALALQQTALLIDGRHALAATELGGLLARCGRLQDAREVLRHGLSQNPSPETWRQLANVHAQLGEVELANQAHVEWTRITQLSRREQAATVTAPNGMTVKWVDKETFERNSREVGLGQATDPPTQTFQTANRPPPTNRIR